MEPAIIALICAAAFGGIVAITALIRQLILSRDKLLNDEAQRRALAQEAEELTKIREQMQSSKRFDSHYKLLGANKDAIIYLDNKIEEIFHKKASLIERYSQLALNESESIIGGKITQDRKKACDSLKAEIDEEMKAYDQELMTFQQRRGSLCDNHKNLQDHLLKQEQARNEHLDDVYKQHANLLEKVYLRHTDNAERVAMQGINAATTTFKSIILAPIQFLFQYFTPSSGVSISQVQAEQILRNEVAQVQKDINDSSNEFEHSNVNDPINPEDSEEALEEQHTKALRFMPA